MKITQLTDFSLEELLVLYASVGWTNYTSRPEMLEKAYQNSLLTLAAYEDGRLAGVIRTVGDGCSVVLIQDLLVLPEYQRRGIGSSLVRSVMERFPKVYQLQLMTDSTPEHIAFYQSLGFTKAEDAGCCGFLRMLG